MATIGTIQQLGSYLVTGYWASVGQISHHWGAPTVTYNVSGLTSDERFLAESALNAWHDVANINFARVTTDANITFTHSGRLEAYCSSAYALDGVATSANVNISSDWVSRYGTSLDSYSYQTYLHEIGHALGLGHQGPYNGNADYGVDNLFANDTWQYSIMSYFSQDDYGGGSRRMLAGPQIADIYAIQQIYGASNTRAGDTVYGFNSSAGPTYNFANYSTAPALTIFDAGGVDTIDVSGYAQEQLIDLRPGAFSSIGGLRYNVATSTNTIIENAIGGRGNDIIIGNQSANIIEGGRGNDTITGVAASFDWNVSGSVFVVDFSADNRADIVQIEQSGLVRGAISNGSGFSAVTNWGEGARIGDQHGYFNSDSRADLIEFNDGGTIYVWTSNGTSLSNYASWGSGARSADRLADVNGDGRTDIIEPHENGNIYVWTSTGTGFSNYTIWGHGARPTDVTGDFNGDGLDDLIELHENGHAYVWTSIGTSFSPLSVWGSGFSPQFDRVADVNGDGRDDILEIDNFGRMYVWTANASGTGFNNFQQWGAGARSTDQIGDFNGDGRDDVIELHENGNAYVWLSNGSGFSNYSVWATEIGPHYQVADLNADGRMDLVGLNRDGAADVLLSNGAGFTSRDTWRTGVGNDTFVFRAAFGHDTITDFTPESSDVIQFDSLMFADYNVVQSHSTDDGHGNTIITYDANNSVTLLGVSVAELTSRDFLFV